MIEDPGYGEYLYEQNQAWEDEQAHLASESAAGEAEANQMNEINSNDDWLDSVEAIKLFIAYAENPLAVGPQLIDAIRRNRDKIRSEP